MQEKKQNEKTLNICGAKSKRSGEPCQAKPMDNGRCRMHGGMNKDDKRFLPDNPRNPVGAPIKHGRYSKYLKGKLGDKVEAFANDKEILDMTAELVQTRALLTRILEELDKDKYAQEDVDNFNKLTDQVRKLTESIIKIETIKKYAMTPEEVHRIMKAIGGVIFKEIKDEDLRDRVVKEIDKIKVM
ncbi:hypothetical protein CMI37_05205 [Candidatus Pacearchaeota archaeon]|nr:hypothetical protein [Candidatus Pacearchaeota archaeon]|tara:strand:- start:665 stop:1222 length:558 start_codon:yes stop_codon:yes gene_type:complete